MRELFFSTPIIELIPLVGAVVGLFLIILSSFEFYKVSQDLNDHERIIVMGLEDFKGMTYKKWVVTRERLRLRRKYWSSFRELSLITTIAMVVLWIVLFIS